MGLKAYNVICTNDISEDYDVDALGATDFEAYACDDVDEHIGKLEAELAALKEAQRWRKCSEELPKYDEYVFAFCPDYGSVEKARLLEDGEWRDSDWNFLEVTHWMPLLKAPEDGK